MNKLFPIAIFLFAISLIPYAHAKERLFGSYIYGEPISSFDSSDEYYDCSREIGATAYCQDEVPFLGVKFEGVFLFFNEKLASVVLISEFNQDLYHQVMDALGRTFELIGLSNMTDELDFMELVRSVSSQSEFASRVNSFERLSLHSGYLDYIFFESDIANYRAYANVYEVVQSNPKDARLSEVSIIEDDWSSLIRIEFSLPKLHMEKIQSRRQHEIEDF